MTVSPVRSIVTRCKAEKKKHLHELAKDLAGCTVGKLVARDTKCCPLNTKTRTFKKMHNHLFAPTYFTFAERKLSPLHCLFIFVCVHFEARGLKSSCPV